MSSKRHTVKTVCSHDCPDACSVLVDVEDGRAVRFRGDPEHPVTRGFLCGKVNRYHEVVHASDRLLHPLRRTGAKGEARFERISWDEALDEIAREIETRVSESGGSALLQYFYAGTMGLVHRNCADALFYRLGGTRLIPNICYYGTEAGYRSVVGGGYGMDLEDVVHSDLIVVWGSNIATTQVHLVPFIKEAREQGAELVVVDVYENRTAAMADTFVKIRPGTDALLAFALAAEICREGLEDGAFIERWTTGFDEFRREVLDSIRLEDVAAETGIDAGTIRELARKIGRARAPVAKIGIGLGRNANGASGVRAIGCLMGVTGAFHRLGGGILYDSGSEFRLNLDPVRRPETHRSPSRELLMTDLHRALLHYDDPPIRFLYVHGSNPVATSPEQAAVIRGLEREDLFTVVHERFLTDTCHYADIVLPAPTFAEVSDLYKSYGHLYLQRGQKAIEPRGESRANLDVIQAIGKRLGLDDPWFDRTVDELIEEILDATDHPNFEGLDRERVLAGETSRLNLPRGVSGFAEGFPTASGKLQFTLEEGSEIPGASRLPGYRGDVFAEGEEAHPFRLITPPAHRYLNSSFGNDPAAVRGEGGSPRVLIHPHDAERVAIEDGQPVELYNRLGEVELVAKVTDATSEGVLVAEGTWWPAFSRGGRGINRLTSARLTDFGQGSTFHDNRVGLRGVS